MNDIFNKIINGKIESKIVYKDKFVTAFDDINPKAPVHVIIVTNKIIPTVNDIKSKDIKIVGHLFIVAYKIAKIKKISKSGYRLIVNCNKDGRQEIFHLHMHLIGGKYLNTF